MKRCCRCGVEKPISEFHIKRGKYRQGKCRDCVKERRAELWAEDPKRVERARESWAKHREANAERVREYHRARYLANRELYAERTKAWAAAHPVESAEIARRSRERHDSPERRADAAAKTRRWRRENPEKARASDTAASARRRGAPMDADARAYARVLYGDPCSYCGEPADQLDHIVPLAVHGTSAWDNLTAACRSCNARKKARPLLWHLHVGVTGLR